MPRAYCYRCRRVAQSCVCLLLARINNAVDVHIVQHQQEARHAFGSVALLRVGLTNLAVHVLRTQSSKGATFPRPPNLPCPGPNIALLYPGAPVLESLAPKHRPKSLLALDGTWDQAHRMLRDSPWLQTFTRVSLQPKQPGRYLVRKEPRGECLSTLEAVLAALSLLEPNTPGLSALLAAFDAMNEQQVARCHAAGHNPRRSSPRKAAAPSLPSVLRDEPGRVVVVWGEVHPRANRCSPYALAQWSATRLTEPLETFEAIGDTGALLRERWATYLRANDVVLAWNTRTLRWGKQAGLLDSGLMLKGICANYFRTPIGHVGETIASLNVPPTPLLQVTGRGGARLAMTHALAWHLATCSPAKVC